MKRIVILILLITWPSAVHAQVVAPSQAGQNYGPLLRPSPALSPYLNLVRGGSPAVNYYLGTLSEFDRRTFEARLLAQPDLQLQLTPGIGSPDDLIPRLPQTGHNAVFQYYNPYFGASTGFASVPTGQTRPFVPYNPASGTGLATTSSQQGLTAPRQQPQGR